MPQCLARLVIVQRSSEPRCRLRHYTGNQGFGSVGNYAFDECQENAWK